MLGFETWPRPRGQIAGLGLGLEGLGLGLEDTGLGLEDLGLGLEAKAEAKYINSSFYFELIIRMK